MANLRANNLTGTGGRNAITGAVYFGGDNDTGGLTIADTTDLELGSETNWTIEFWIKLNHSALSDWDVVMGKGSASGNNYEWFVEVMSGDHLVFLTTTAGSAWNFNQQITPALAVGEWYHIAIVRNGSGANTLKSYVNGQQYSTHTSQNIHTSSYKFGIGHFAEGPNTLHSDITLSDVRVVKGTSVYTAAFTPPTSKLTVIPNTVLLCCNDSDDVTQEETGKTITSVGNPVATEDMPPVGVDEGVTFNGDTKVNTQGYMYFPTGDTTQRGRGRGVYGGGADSPNASLTKMVSIEIQSGGNTVDFGSLTGTNRAWIQGLGSSTRGIWFGGADYGGSNKENTIDYVTIATTGDATDFGDSTKATGWTGSVSNDTRGVNAGGYPSGSNTNAIDYITIATTGNASDFGDLTGANRGLCGMSSPTRGVFAGGYVDPAVTNVIQYITIATTGNATDFGDLLAAGRHDAGGAVFSQTRGVVCGSYAPTTNAMEYITIATTGNALDFGDLLVATAYCGGVNNTTRGVLSGSFSPSKTNTMNYITIATTGNSLDFGDNTSASVVYGQGGTSDSHGGLSE